MIEAEAELDMVRLAKQKQIFLPIYLSVTKYYQDALI